MNDIGQQLIQNVEELERDAARQRSAAERGSMLAFADGTRRALGGRDESQRDPACERLGRRGDVRHHDGIEQLIREVRSRAPDAALDLVEHQQRVVAIGQIPRRADVFVGQRIDPAFALHDLDHDARGVLADYLFQRADIVAMHKAGAGQHRLKIAAIFLLAGNGERTERAAVEGIEQRYRLILVRADLAAVRADHLERAFHRLRARSCRRIRDRDPSTLAMRSASGP